ncbi:hypothetical protein EBB07_20240 [Paenibacillaceae bacterium]|nr:hypothetical protein EBB07_20240 [Paenibacillaceae bacterium]
MEQFTLDELAFSQGSLQYKLAFSDAVLVVVSELGSRFWYIDVSGIEQTALLEAFHTQENIRIDLSARTVSGQQFRGIGYFHANVVHQAAAIRGDGELEGYNSLS